MKNRVASILVALLFLPVSSLGQEQRAAMPERNSIDWFDFAANYHEKPLLLKLLQFTAPYPGYYQQTSLDTEGNTFSARNVPNWAVQASRHAKLNDALLAEVKQLLVQLNVPDTPAVIQPEHNRLHSAFVFYDGHDFKRFNYNGANPAPIAAILAILEKEFRAGEQAWDAEMIAHRKLILASYGDWENRPGITFNAGASVNRCKETSALVLLAQGQRKDLAAGPLTKVSLYHALVFYPLAVLVGAGGGGRWEEYAISEQRHDLECAGC